MEEPEQTKKAAVSKNKLRLAVAAIAIALVIGVLWVIFYVSRTTAPPPDLVNMANNVNYPIYYPSKLPSGYTYIDNSVKLQSGLLYYKLHNGTKTISITEQPVPSSAVDLSKLPLYSSLNVPAGPAAIGVGSGNPAVVISTGSTLVNINSSKGVNKETVISIAQKISRIDTKAAD